LAESELSTSFFQIKKLIDLSDVSELPNGEADVLIRERTLNASQSKKFYTYISTDITGKRIFIQSMQFQRIFVIKDIIENFSRPLGLFSVIESIQISSSDSQPIIEVMTNILQFLYDSVVMPKNQEEIQQFLEMAQNLMKSEDEEQMPKASRNCRRNHYDGSQF